MAKKIKFKKTNRSRGLLPKLDLSEFIWNTSEYRANVQEEPDMLPPDHPLDGENVDWSLDLQTPDVSFCSDFEEAMMEIDMAHENNRDALISLIIAEAVKRGAKEKDVRKHLLKTWKR